LSKSTLFIYFSLKVLKQRVIRKQNYAHFFLFPIVQAENVQLCTKQERMILVSKNVYYKSKSHYF